MQATSRWNFFSWVVAGLIFMGLVHSATAEDKAATKIELANGKYVMVAPATWESVPPKINMISHEFRAPKEAKDDAARITVTAASGGIEANLDRWVGQFDGAKKADAKIEKKDVSGTIIHLFDMAGTYNDSSGGPFAGKVTKRENYRMIAAIIETKEAGTFFIKMTGSKATVESLAEDFKKSLMELKSK